MVMVEAPAMIVGIGDIKIGRSPVLIRTNLGSCIGVCLYNSQLKVGGMLHCMLPSAEGHKDKPGFRPTKYADSGLSELIAQLKRAYGLEPRQFTAKIFGGASMFKVVSINIGRDNEQSVRAILKENGIPVLAFKTGGEKSYKIDFNLMNGLVSCRNIALEAEEF